MTKKASRRKELLTAARDVFANKGYHDAKVDDIVAQARVAKGTFYLYFPDKRSAFAELVDGLFTKIAGVIKTVDTRGDVEAQVRENIDAVVTTLVEDKALTQILLSYAAGIDPAFVAKITSFYDGTKLLLQESLAFGQRLGIVAEGDTAIFATCTVGALKELLLEDVTRKEPRSKDAIVEALFAFLQRGYLRLGSAAHAQATKARAAR